jgi:thioredoxin reductase (NADPH)
VVQQTKEFIVIDTDKDEQFYRDTEAIAFPKLDDRQLALLVPLGRARTLRRGDMLFSAGERDLGLTVVISGELEAFETRDGAELTLATPGPRDFVGDVAMLTGNATLVCVRGKADESEILVIGASEFRRALSELPGLGEIIVSALIMRRKRLQRDREFAGFRIVACRGAVRAIKSTIFWIRTMSFTACSIFSVMRASNFASGSISNSAICRC